VGADRPLFVPEADGRLPGRRRLRTAESGWIADVRGLMNSASGKGRRDEP